MSEDPRNEKRRIMRFRECQPPPIDVRAAVAADGHVHAGPTR